MLVLGPIAFATPWVLFAVAVLPGLWWLLRLTPPPPRQMRFPAVALLRDLVTREETPARTPPWLLALRVAIAGCVILGLATPVLHPDAPLPGAGPLVLVIDDGWSAARDWSTRLLVADGLVDRAERQNRAVVVATTALVAVPDSATGTGIDLRTPVSGPMRASDARRLIQGLEPHPWPGDRTAALAALGEAGKSATVKGGSAVWLSDGLADAGSAALARYLADSDGGLEVAIPKTLPDLLLPPVAGGEALTARLTRAAPDAARTVRVRLWAGDGRLLGIETASFAAGATGAEVRFVLPLDLRNQAVRLDLEGQPSVGAVTLLDERWRRRPVGLVASRAKGEGEGQPLLDDLYYLERALAPGSDVRRGALEDLLRGDLSVVVLGDVGALTADEITALDDWIHRGGLLLRFAGPRLAQAPDTLVPVHLRVGNRVLGGALSWAKPAHLAPFDAASPLAGLAIPDDVTVERQVLAEPTPDIAERTWARLADGTPLVTAERRGQGSVILVHTTASPEWSTLALSGLFVDLLNRIIALSAGVQGEGGTAPLPPLAALDGLARLGEPPATAQPITPRDLTEGRVGPTHPPGVYGTTASRRALNLTAGLTKLRPLGPPPPDATTIDYAQTGELALKPWLLAAGFGLLLADMVLALILRGLMRPPNRTLHGVALLVVLALPATAQAAGRDASAPAASAKTMLAYVVTGDAAVDQVSRAGLEGLVPVLLRRTAIDAGGVVAVHVDSDELSFYPLLYWPVSETQPTLSEPARRRVNDYLHHGGMILFDTRDDQPSDPAALRALTEGLDIPALTPLPSDHVLTKSFYLLQDFPGRIDGGRVWVEAREDRRLDGVSPVIVGGSDWAGAWAVDPQGQPLFAVVPGGERQREMAYRFGVNLLMYAMTGNYKADQVHVPAILERLGQ